MYNVKLGYEKKKINTHLIIVFPVSRVLLQCSSYAPLLQGHSVRICAMRAMPAIWEFDDKWYELAEEQELIGKNNKCVSRVVKGMISY